MRPSWALHALVLGVVGLSCVGARWDYTADDTRDALEGAPYMVRCIVALESSFDPNAVGAAGEQGVAQILPSWNGGGQWDEFFGGDWTDVPPEERSTWNPWQSVAFLEAYGAEHGYGAWTTSAYC